MAKHDYIVHAQALGEVYLSQYKDKIKHLETLTIRKIKKDGKYTDVVVKKDDLPTALCQVFEDGVTDLSDISIRKVEHGISEELTSITIY